MEESAENRGVFASLKRLLETLFAIAQNRLELLLVELQQERWRFFEALLLAGIVIVLALMTLMVVTLTIIVLCINHNRIDVIVGLSLLYLAATLAVFWRLRIRLKKWAPFSATLAEIKKDKTCLEEKS